MIEWLVTAWPLVPRAQAPATEFVRCIEADPGAERAPLPANLAQSIPIGTHRVAGPQFLAAQPIAQEAKEGAGSKNAKELDGWFKQLAQAEDARQAAVLEEKIVARLAQSGSAVADLLVARAKLSQQNPEDHGTLARQFLDEAVAIAPDCLECRLQRAYLAISGAEVALALQDLNAILTQEPRHFVAWTLLGQSFESVNQPEAALNAYETAIRIAPFLEGARSRILALTIKVRGRPA